MRRKPGQLLPLEESILAAGVALSAQGHEEFHGFLVAKEIQSRELARRLTAHGTLYKALERLERMGLLESRWEDPAEAAAEGRPRRRLYRVTGAGDRAVLPSEPVAGLAAERRPLPGADLDGLTA